MKIWMTFPEIGLRKGATARWQGWLIMVAGS